MNKALYLFDVNVAANAGGNLGGVYSSSEWECAHPGASWGIQVINRAIQLGLRLTASQSHLATLETTLRKQDASDFEPLDADSARATATSFAALVHASDGVMVNNHYTRKHIAAAKRAISDHLHGNAKGQIDHEDFTVIASAMAAMANDPQTQGVVIVSDDRGVVNCARDLARIGIAVLSPAQFLSLNAAQFAAAA